MPPAPSPLFASVALAARIERAECGLLASGVEVAGRRRPDEGAFALPIAGGVATWARRESPLDKVAGLGFAGVPDDAELDAVERAFAERDTPVRVELATLGDPAVATALGRRGYLPAGFENVLGRPLEATPAPAAPAGISVSRSDEAELSLWLDVVVDGFAHPDEQGVASDEEFPREVLERVIGDLSRGAGFGRYLARRDGEPAGGAGLRVDQGVAQLCGAATLPAHRRCGIQSALLAARLAAAASAGCDLAVVTTQPGSKSQQNAERQGFALLYVRAVFVRG